MSGFYVLNSLIYSLVGGFIGYRYCAMTMDINSMKRRLHMEDPAEATPSGLLPPLPVRSRWDPRQLHRPNVQQVIGFIVVVMAIASTVLVTVYSQRLNTVSNCLANYVEDSTDALKARDDVAARTRDNAKGFASAGDDLWLGFLRNAPKPGEQATDAQRAASLAVLNAYMSKSKTYQNGLDELTRARQAFPIPANNCPGAKVQDR